MVWFWYLAPTPGGSRCGVEYGLCRFRASSSPLQSGSGFAVVGFGLSPEVSVGALSVVVALLRYMFFTAWCAALEGLVPGASIARALDL